MGAALSPDESVDSKAQPVKESDQKASTQLVNAGKGSLRNDRGSDEVA